MDDSEKERFRNLVKEFRDETEGSKCRLSGFVGFGVVVQGSGGFNDGTKELRR